jgi:hypothetical protein
MVFFLRRYSRVVGRVVGHTINGQRGVMGCASTAPAPTATFSVLQIFASMVKGLFSGRHFLVLLLYLALEGGIGAGRRRNLGRIFSRLLRSSARHR